MTDQPTFKDFLYGKRGYYNNLSIPIDPAIQALLKTDVPLTYSGSTTWFDPVYLGKLELESLTRSKSAYSALRKTSYQQEGDSYQVIATDAHGGLGNILEAGVLFGTTSVPALVDVDSIYPALLTLTWSNTEVAAALSGIQRSRATPTLEQIRDYMSNVFLNTIEKQICGVYLDATGVAANGGFGVDCPATTPADGTGGTATFECIDRMITDATESADGEDRVSKGEDGDLYWNSTGNGTELVTIGDRSGGEGVATLRNTTTAAVEEAYNICDELDDLMAKCLVYAEAPYNYVAYMSPKAYNKIKAENDPKALIVDYTDARQAINGVSSTPGVVGGKVQLSALRLSDITVPIITAPYLMGTATSTWLWKNTKYTTGGPGNIYLVNQDCMEFRTLIPITYKSFPAENYLETKHILYMAGQLVAKNWKSHGKLCNIAT